jgi:hypothetical protein
VGTGLVLKITPAGYILSGLFAFLVWRQHPQVERVRVVTRIVEMPGEERASA